MVPAIKTKAILFVTKGGMVGGWGMGTVPEANENKGSLNLYKLFPLTVN
jgi:hypothetical protein